MTNRNPDYYLYVMGVDDGPCKIGHTTMPDKRVLSVGYDIGRRVFITGKYPVGARIALAAERYAHWLLRDRHVHGEWFDVPADEAFEIIKRAATTPMDTCPLPPLARDRRIVGAENITTKFFKGTRARLNEATREGETHADLIREAVEKELAGRGFPGRPGDQLYITTRLEVRTKTDLVV